MRKLLLFLVLFSSLQKATAQTNLYVDSSAATSGAGTSWAAAYKTLNEALNTANNGSTTVSYIIHIAKGTYYPTGLQNGTNRDSAFALLRTGLRVYGGYPTGGGTRNFASNQTILSGDIGTAGDSLDNSYHVVVLSNLSASGDSVILDGVTITKGCASMGGGSKIYSGKTVSSEEGGGVWIGFAEQNTLLRNCTVHRNTGYDGGGVYFRESNTGFENDVFSENSAQYGGAIQEYWPYLHDLKQCTFTNNYAVTNGGGMYIKGYGYPTFRDCAFDQNKTSNASNASGGAVYTYYTDLHFKGCSFNQNESPKGGAVYITDGALVSADTCVFIGNKATLGDGGAVYSAAGSWMGISCKGSVFNANTALSGKGGAIACLASTILDSCQLLNDSARRGGAVYSKVYLTVSKSLFTANYASGKGGAVYTSGTSHNVSTTRMSGNRADTAGGALFVEIPTNATQDFTSLLLSGNVAGQQGGAVALVNNNNNLDFTNCTFAGDSAVSGNGMHCSNASPELKNCILWEGAGNSLFTVNNSYPTITYSLVEGGFAGTGNISSSPAFVAPQPATTAPTPAGDYSLTGCSPAINVGQNTGSYAGVVDFAGNPRLADNVVDMGAYEFQRLAIAGTISGPGLACVGDVIPLMSSVSGGTWTSLDPTQITVDASGVATVLSPGPSTIQYTVMSNGCPVSSVISITAQSPPALPVITTVNNGSPVCLGTVYPVAYFSQNGGVWTVSDTSVTAIQNYGAPIYLQAKAAGNSDLILTAIGTNGCSAADTVSITVNPLPTVPDITGGDTLCAGTTMQLSNPMPSGVWGATQVLSSGFTVSSTGLVTGTVPGDGWATYSVTNALGCVGIDSQAIHVNPSPVVAPPIGPETICVNTPITYTHPIPGGTWSVFNTRGSITAGGIYTATSTAGGNNVFYTLTNPVTGCSGKGSLIVQALGPVSNAISATFCLFPSYNFGGQMITAAGVYTKTFQTYYGCDSVVTLTYTDVGPNDGVTVSGGTLTAVQTGVSYKWFECTPNGIIVVGWNSRSYTPNHSGQFGVFVDNGICTKQSACYTVTAAGVSTVSTEKWNLYPNPTTGSATLQTGSIISKRIAVRDITGKLLLEVTPASTETVLDMKGFASGLYLVTVLDAEGNTATLRLTVN